jgi:pyrroline-5-carboxylate reductase
LFCQVHLQYKGGSKVLHEKRIGFLGAGSITESLIRGLLAKGVTTADRLWITNRSNRARLADLAAAFGVQVVANQSDLVGSVDVLVLACKPKDVAEALVQVGPLLRPDQVLLSVAAGIGTEAIAAGVTQGVQIVRAMPNTSCQVGESATAICLGPGAGSDARAICVDILGAVGQVVEVPEAQLDAVTGLSGSGPAYIYYLVEALVEAGRTVGLSDRDTQDLVMQTLKGAAKMLTYGEDPAVLRRKVTSPGGTTMAGIQELEAAGFKAAIVQAVTRATERSRELGTLLAVPTGSKHR